MNEILNRIKTLRVSKNLKQSEFAKILNMTQGGYSKIELGVTELSVNTLFKIADALGVSVQYLLFGEEQETRGDSEKDKKIKELETKIKTLTRRVNFLRSVIKLYKFENKIFFGLVKGYEYYSQRIIKKQEETKFLDKLSSDEQFEIIVLIEHYKKSILHTRQEDKA